MRKIIAALRVSLDGFIEGPNGELDWVDSWEDPYNLLERIDTCILGGGMYPDYENYWLSILANPEAILPITGRPATEEEIAYARFAGKTPHFVLSKTLNQVALKTTRIVRNVDDIRELKQLPGKDIHAVGGATLVSSLMNAGLVDEIQLVVHPVVLGSGKPLFKDVKERHALNLVEAKSIGSGMVKLSYTVPNS